MIEITNLRVDRNGKRICTVDQLSIAAGQRVGLLGSNGSGKTTLLRVLAGLTSDYTGTCEVAAPLHERTYLHQQPYLFRGSVLANTSYGQRNEAGQGTQAREWLDRLGVGHLAERTTADLSGGERRRVALARSLAMQPQLLLLDEPLADLDPDASQLVYQTLTELANTTLLIASPIALPEGLANTTITLSRDALTAR